MGWSYRISSSSSLQCIYINLCSRSLKGNYINLCYRQINLIEELKEKVAHMRLYCSKLNSATYSAGDAWRGVHLCFKLRVQEKETKSEQNNGRKLSSNGEIKSAQSNK